ncbi:MAG: segregation/condensation protein A [Actinomycetota bacterium]|nr:segregation/condensation protein A [Actinomycetota bacterium]
MTDQMTDVALTPVPGGLLTSRSSGVAFEVHLDVFEGPFDLLLGLISKHKLDITEVALAKVTDEFIGWIRAYREVNGTDWDLAKASEFLVVAATLLDLKSARLLPSADGPDEEDLALIEARDLLFARLLQYRAFKGIAAVFQARMSDGARRLPRQVGLEPHLAKLLPELVFGITPDQLALLAAKAMTPRPDMGIGLDHLHAPTVSVREQAAIVVERLRHSGTVSFRSLVADAEVAVVVARFLALLELYREGAVAFDQVTALGELSIRWTGSEDGQFGVGDEFDGDLSAGPTRDGPPEPIPAASAGPAGLEAQVQQQAQAQVHDGEDRQ